MDKQKSFKIIKVVSSPFKSSKSKISQDRSGQLGRSGQVRAHLDRSGKIRSGQVRLDKVKSSISLSRVVDYFCELLVWDRFSL